MLVKIIDCVCQWDQTNDGWLSDTHDDHVTSCDSQACRNTSTLHCFWSRQHVSLKQKYPWNRESNARNMSCDFQRILNISDSVQPHPGPSAKQVLFVFLIYRWVNTTNKKSSNLLHFFSLILIFLCDLLLAGLDTHFILWINSTCLTEWRGVTLMEFSRCSSTVMLSLTN